MDILEKVWAYESIFKSDSGWEDSRCICVYIVTFGPLTCVVKQVTWY